MDELDVAMNVKELAILAGHARNTLMVQPENREARDKLRLVTEVLLMRARIAELQTEVAKLKRESR